LGFSNVQQPQSDEGQMCKKTKKTKKHGVVTIVTGVIWCELLNCPYKINPLTNARGKKETGDRTG
jgi:hypothetical protein